ncbi:LuxR C-terminal-related transcriptional regulator [Azotobacter beijerinckii]|uniref:LuxR family transcriptional regulator, maltose regulon positive regulatory protein n=1 Tax=Azotobacter beijerinckii TaxID=170623 RepID=A0A1I4C1X5_9GAMM|nr:LuxR C-terminal-related transcriptional regulator [Azotobacter beijerinckii]SFB29050.1 LuxR family transcriptional regulator, maltose regulon positive regulatory protein [Azotobacter beijerinckii]SFK74161.1 LuxR family transcriptional regulator, maltose regulon positive regulatory protein [Azotobacter beijerinckii]
MDRRHSERRFAPVYSQGTCGLPLIATKFVPPRSPGVLLVRPRLLARLEPLAERSLALVCAGAGFGKTTLLAQWRSQLQERGEAVAWLSLDEGDDVPEYFCHYLLDALLPLHPGLGWRLGFLAAGLPSIDRVFGHLINAVQAVEAPLYLVVDDYHAIRDPAIHRAFAYLLEHAPANLHVLLGSRSLPSLPLSRLRSRHQLIEVDTNDLRFNLCEARHYFADSAALALSNAQTQRLLEVTEGWITGMQMATLSPSIKDNPAQVIDSLSHGGRLVGRYLEDVVFEPLPAAVDDFLMRTSILDRFCAELCDAVTGRNDGHAMLDWIERHNLFVAALDDHGQWFRYHHLFAETLQTRLRRRTDLDISTLHERAGNWFAGQSLWAEATRHALAAGKVESAPGRAGLGAQSLAERGDIDTLLGWLQQLPITADEHRISLQLNLAWALAHRFRFDESRRLLGELRRWFAVHPARRDLRVKLDAVAAICEAFAENVQTGIALAEPLLAQIPCGDRWVDGLVCNVLSYCHLVLGQHEQAQAVQRHTLYPGAPTENLFVTVHRAFILGQSHLRQGDLRTAEACFLQAMESADRLTGPQSSGSATLAASLAELAYERGDWERLDALVRQRGLQIDRVAPLDGVLAVYRALCRRALAEDDGVQARLLLQHAQEIAAQRRWNRLQAALLAEQVRLQLQRDDLAGAEHMLRRIELLKSDEGAIPGCRHYARIARARLLLAQGLGLAAADCLAGVVAEFEARGQLLEAVRLRPLWAIALWQGDEREAAADALLPALQLGLRENLLCSLTDAGPALLPLLTRCAAVEAGSGDLPGYIALLRERLGGDTFVEPPFSLSERESQTLRLVAAGQSNKEIARSLDISVETVKWHLKNLYGKLQVTSRTRAMSRARELSLLE